MNYTSYLVSQCIIPKISTNICSRLVHDKRICQHCEVLMELPILGSAVWLNLRTLVIRLKINGPDICTQSAQCVICTQSGSCVMTLIFRVISFLIYICYLSLLVLAVGQRAKTFPPMKFQPFLSRQFSSLLKGQLNSCILSEHNSPLIFNSQVGIFTLILKVLTFYWPN